MYIVKYNLTNIKYNPTNNSVCVCGGGGGGGINVYLKFTISKKRYKSF